MWSTHALKFDIPYSEVKASACNAGDLGLIPGSGRSPGEGNGNPLQYSCLENPMDRGAWWATVHGIAKSRTWISDFTFTFTLHPINLKTKGKERKKKQTNKKKNSVDIIKKCFWRKHYSLWVPGFWGQTTWILILSRSFNLIRLLINMSKPWWALDHKKGWASKNFCFWVVMLESCDVESTLDSKEIKPVNPKGSQSWIFTRRTDAEAEVPILWPPDGKRQIIGKYPDAWKDWV